MINNTFLTMIAVIVGYVLMALLITLVQEVWLGGIEFGTTPFGRLAIGGVFTMLAALVGAAVATAIVRRSTFAPAIIMSCLVAIETTTLVLTDKVSGPLWFDVLSAFLLIIAILGGAIFWTILARSWASGNSKAA